MSKTWFGVNRLWGWYPTSWEGWVVLLGMVSSISATVYFIDSNADSVSDTLFEIFPFVSLTIAFTMLVATLKGASPEFGKHNKHSKNYSPDFPKAYLFLCLLALPLVAYYLFFKAYIGAAVLTVVFCLLYLVYFNLNKGHRLH